MFFMSFFVFFNKNAKSCTLGRIYFIEGRRGVICMQYLYFLLFAAVIGIFHEEVFQIISTVLETTVTIIGLYLFFKLI